MMDFLHEREAKPVGFPLADVIEVLGNELRVARERAEQRPEKERMLRLGDCSVELDVTFSVEANGTLKPWVIEVGAKVSHATTTTMTVNLKPLYDTPAYMADNENRPG